MRYRYNSKRRTVIPNDAAIAEVATEKCKVR